MNKNKAIFIASASLSVAMFAWDRIETRRRNLDLTKRAEAAQEEHKRFMADMDALNKDLDRRIEAGKFWLIVTQPD